MWGMLAKRFAVFPALALVAACGGDPELMNISTAKPDEFAVLPTKPLQAPEDYAALPPPTPGGTNLADPSPQADAVAALGGNPERLKRGQIAASERGLLAYAQRYGATPDIRQVLADEDLEWRRANNGRLLERLFNVNVYYSSYKPMSLDQHVELQRLRKMGIWTPSAPPDPQVPFE